MLNEVGLDFTSGTPRVVNDYAILYFPFRPSIEGCSSISDRNGRLLFYTNGTRAMAADHQTNLVGDGLYNCGSATQGALIVPQPGNERYYYVFTLNGEDCLSGGMPAGSSSLGAEIIDMTLNSGLGGWVPQRFNYLNVPISSEPLLHNVTEKLTAVHHRNGSDVWVMAHLFDSNGFVCFRVSAQGISSDTVVSFTGEPHQGTTNMNIGQMKFSADGSKVALVILRRPKVELFDFDNATGKVSNPVSIPLAEEMAPYGVEFSPDGSKLYVSCIGNQQLHANNPPVVDSLYQFDLTYPTGQELARHRYGFPLHEFLWQKAGSLQTGPDGKIYLALFEERFLGVVNNPNASGAACQFDRRGVVLSPINDWKGTFALPNFITSYFYPKPQILASQFCTQSPTEFALKNAQYIASVNWDFGDDSLPLTGVSAQHPLTHRYVRGGEYIVSAHYTLGDRQLGQVTDTITLYDPPRVTLPADTLVCYQSGWQLTPSVQSLSPVSYRWQDGSINSSYPIKNPGLYWVEVRSQAGCQVRDSIRVRWTAPLVDLGRDTLLCYTHQLKLNVTRTDADSYQWQDGLTTPIRWVNKPGYYSVAVRVGKCIDYDTIAVLYQECDSLIQIPNVITPNGDEWNQTFVAQGLQPGKWKLTIVNRWGQLVYTTAAYANDWSGESQPAGVYFYELLNADNRRRYRGWFQLLR